MTREELDEVDEVVCEIRRCLNFFVDETETAMEVDDCGENFAYITNTKTGSRFIVKVEKLK